MPYRVCPRSRGTGICVFAKELIKADVVCEAVDEIALLAVWPIQPCRSRPTLIIEFESRGYVVRYLVLPAFGYVVYFAFSSFPCFPASAAT
jgi:hypothetical protein